MANSQSKIEFKIGYSVDKSGLEQMQSMFQQIANKAQEPGKKISEGLKKAGETAATLDKILDKTFNSDLGTLNVTKFNQELAKSNLTLKDVKNNLVAEGNLGATAYNKLTQSILGTNQQLKQSNKLLDDMAKSFKNVLSWGVASSIFNTVTASIKNAYSYTKQLNSSLNDIRIVTDKSAESMEKFAIQANNAAKNLGASTLDYSNAALIYYQQGLSDEEAKARAETTVKAANITGQTGEAVSEQLTAVWNGYKVSAEETELYVDKLAAVAATTASDLEELSVGMSKVASAANAMGVDFDDLNAQMSTIISVTRQAPESVGTALKTIYARLGDLKVDGVDEFGVKLGEVTSNLKAMGIEILDQQGNMRDMTSVMTEVAEKWSTWTEAQKQAAAIAMAGKRQYNNLIALFENWDMYTDALETSTDAMGTLQHQQDIYMESTEAKLKKLKATWQDLYAGLIDSDEINFGVDALTNLVQTFDNFTDSFGGGVKSLMGFGAIIANIFSKQISNGITNVIQQTTTLSNNLDLMKAKAETFSLGAADVEKASPVDLGIQANTQDQLETAKAIYAVRQGINNEQAQTLINDQKIKGELVQQKTILEEKIKRTEKDVFDQKELENYLKMDLGTLEGIVADKEDEVKLQKELLESQKEITEQDNKAVKAQERIESTLNNTLKKYKNLKDTVDNTVQMQEKLNNSKKAILGHAKALTEEQQKQLKNVLDNVHSEEELKNAKGEILKITKGTTEEEVTANQQVLNSLIKILGIKRETYDIDQQIKNKEIEIREIIEKAGTGANVTQVVTSVTSSLSTMAMAWSSVNSLMQTFEDKNVSMSDKISQAMMTLGMTIPMMISSITKLNQAFGRSVGIAGTFRAIQLKNAAASELSSLGLGVETKALKKKTNQELEDLVIQKLIEKQQLKDNEGRLLNAATIDAQTRKIILKNNEETKEIATLIKLKAANDSLNASMLSLTAGMAVIALLAAGISFAVKKQEELTQATIDANNEEIERINKIQEETDANKELYDSFEDLYTKYKAGKVEKEELFDVTDKLCEAYKMEDVYLAALAGDYDKINELIKTNRKLELDNTIRETGKEVTAAAENLITAQNKSKAGWATKSLHGEDFVNFNFDKGFDSTFDDLFNFGTIPHRTIANLGIKAFNAITGSDVKEIEKFNIDAIDDEIGKYLAQNITGGEYSSATGFSVTQIGEGADGIVKTYEELQQAMDYLSTYYQEAGRAAELQDSEIYTSIRNYLGEMQDSYDAYKQGQSQLQEYKVQQIFEDNNLLDIHNAEDYKNTISAIREQLIAVGKDAEEVENIITSYIKGIDNDFVQVERGIEELDLISEAEREKIKSWSDEDKAFLFSGYVNFDGLKTAESLEAAIDVAKAKIHTDDLDVVVSLRAKLTSDKKLSKKEVEEVLGEEATLAKDYEVELYDFERQSRLDQLDILNDVTKKEIALDVERLSNLEEVTKKEIELNKIATKNAIAEYNRRYQELGNFKIAHKDDAKDENGNYIDEEVQAEYNKLRAQFEEAKATRTQLAGDLAQLEDSLNPESIVDTINESMFNDIIQGIDGVISEAKVLSELAGEIGENWTIAAKDIEDFSLHFADVMKDQENYNILQDGSLQLTEKGKAAYQEIMETKKAELTADYEAYKLELQRQIDIHEANARYYEERANLLEKFLKGEADAKDTAAGLESALSTYKLKLAEAVGQGDKKLTEQIQKNLNNTNDVARENIGDQWDYYNALGITAARAAQAGQTGSFEPYEFPGKQSSGETNVAEADNTEEQNAAEDLTAWLEEELENNKQGLQDQIDEDREEAQKQWNMRDIEISKQRAADSSMQSALNSIGNSGNGKGSSGSRKKNKEHIKDEIDELHKYKKIIESTERELKRLNKTKEGLKGKNYIAALNKENNLLTTENQQYRELIKQTKKVASEEKGKLTKLGATFDENNNISNYAEMQQQFEDSYNAAIDAYNNSAKTEMDEHLLNIAKQTYDENKKLLDNFEGHVKDINDYIDKKEENRLKKIKNNLAKFETKIQLKLDKKEFDKDLRTFNKELNKNITKAYSDYSKEISYNRGQFKDTRSEVNTRLNEMKEIENEINKMRNGGKSKMFDTIDLAQEKLKEVSESMEQYASEMEGYFEDAWKAYIDGINQAKEKYGELQEAFERANKELEHQGQVIELVWGEESYDLLDTLYEGQRQASLNRMEAYKSEADTWAEQLRNKLGDKNLDLSKITPDQMFDWNEDEKQYFANWQEAQSNLQDETINNLQIIKKEYENMIQSIGKELENSLTAGAGFDEMEYEWERITREADRYYDSVEKSYEIQTLANKWDKEISSVSEVKTQQKLKKLRDEMLKQLREKEKLSEYDVKYAELEYQLELKRIALEESQNNKTSMKLTRNAEGNWSYQYVANEDDVKNKQQEYLDTWHEMHELTVEEQKKNEEDAYNITKKYHERVMALEKKYGGRKLTDKEIKKYNAERERLEKDYQKDMNEIAEDAAKYRNNLQITSAGILTTVYRQNKEAYQGFTRDEKILVDKLKEHHLESYNEIEKGIKTNLDNIGKQSEKVASKTFSDWDSNISKVIQMWDKNNDASITSKIKQAYADFDAANIQWQKGMKDAETTSGTSFGKEGILKDITAIVDQTYKAKTGVEVYSTTVKTQLPQLAGIVTQMANAWGKTVGNIDTATTKLSGYLKQQKAIDKDITVDIKTKYTTEGKPNEYEGNDEDKGKGKTPPVTPPPNLNKASDEKYEYVNYSNGSASGYRIRITDVYAKKLEDKVNNINRMLQDPNIPNQQKQAYEKELKEIKADSDWQALQNQKEYENFVNDEHTSNSQKQLKGVEKVENTGMYVKNKKKLDKWAIKRGYDAFATGGYTGTWGDDGRLALLHQKELVLNAEDTENLLSGISMIRDMSSLNGSINNSILKAISNMMLSLTGINTGLIGGATTDNSSSNTTFNITAEFPNAENVNDIREAILSLPNLASQFKGQRLK